MDSTDFYTELVGLNLRQTATSLQANDINPFDFHLSFKQVHDARLIITSSWIYILHYSRIVQGENLDWTSLSSLPFDNIPIAFSNRLTCL